MHQRLLFNYRGGGEEPDQTPLTAPPALPGPAPHSQPVPRTRGCCAPSAGPCHPPGAPPVTLLGHLLGTFLGHLLPPSWDISCHPPGESPATPATLLGNLPGTLLGHLLPRAPNPGAGTATLPRDSSCSAFALQLCWCCSSSRKGLELALAGLGSAWGRERSAVAGDTARDTAGQGTQHDRGQRLKGSSKARGFQLCCCSGGHRQ